LVNKTNNDFSTYPMIFNLKIFK